MLFRSHLDSIIEETEKKPIESPLSFVCGTEPNSDPMINNVDRYEFNSWILHNSIMAGYSHISIQFVNK